MRYRPDAKFWHHYFYAVVVIGILVAVNVGAILILRVPPPPIPPSGLDPNFSRQVNECFIPVAAIYGYTLRVASGFRSLGQQAAIYDSGRNVDGHIVTWAEPGRSLHNYGFAVDVVDRWRGYNIDFDKLAKIGTYCGLEQVDPPHFEHRAGLTTDQFAQGMRPPPLTLPCQVMDDKAKAGQPLTLQDLKNNNCGLPQF